MKILGKASLNYLSVKQILYNKDNNLCHNEICHVVYFELFKRINFIDTAWLFQHIFPQELHTFFSEVDQKSRESVSKEAVISSCLFVFSYPVGLYLQSCTSHEK